MSSTSSNGATARSRLYNSIVKEIHKSPCKVGLTTFHFEYIGFPEFDWHSKHGDVEGVFEEDTSIPSDEEASKDDLIRWVKSDAYKIFGITIVAKLDLQFLWYLYLDNIVDKGLPLRDLVSTNNTSLEYGKYFERFQQYQHLASYTIERGFPSKTEEIPIIPGSGRELTCGLPIQMIEELGKGSGGSVFKVRIDTGHHHISEINSDSFFSKEVALKLTLRSPQSRAELEFLSKMSDCNLTHDHITKTYAGIQFADLQGNDSNGFTCLVSELAKQTLGEYLKSDSLSHPGQREEAEGWLRYEMLCLARTLNLIHTPPVANGYDLSTLITGVHHDINLENILLFEDDQGKKMLKFADWGCTRFIERLEDAESDKASGQGPCFTPPKTLAQDGKTSRPHDVWSLGCVFVLILVKLSRDGDYFEKFHQDMFGDGTWRTDGPGSEPVLQDYLKEELDVLSSFKDCKWKP